MNASLETRYDPAPVRDLVGSEASGLGMGANVGAYVAVLTESNVRAMLQRKARLSAELTRTSVSVR